MARESSYLTSFRVALEAALLAALPYFPLCGGTVSAPMPGESPWFDTENSTNLAFRTAGTTLRDFSVDLSFSGSVSNNVEVAVGRDANGDGELLDEEIGMISGWDRGEYFVERYATGERFAETSVGADDSARRLVWHVALRDGLDVRGFAATNETGAAFRGVSSSAPDWLHDASWNMMRVTVRGEGARFGTISVTGTYPGFSVGVR